MSLKDLFFEEVGEVGNSEPEFTEEELNSILASEEAPVDAAVPVAGVDIVNDSYNENGLSDLTKSIFKVEELLNNLPKEMPTVTKKQTVNGTLSVFGLSPEAVIEDGTNRISVLKSVQEQIEASLSEEIEKAEAVIEDYKNKIAEMQTEIASRQETIKANKQAVDSEVERITGLVDFIK